LLFPDIERLLRALRAGSGARRALLPGRVASRAPLGSVMLALCADEGKPIQKIDSEGAHSPRHCIWTLKIS